MKVLMTLPDKRVRGGPPSHLYLLYDELAKQGIDVSSFIYGGRVHDENLVTKILSRLADLLKLIHLVIKIRPDMVQFNSSFDKRAILRDIFFVPVARLMGQKVITKFHGSDQSLLNSAGPVWRALIWVIIRGSNVICLLSGEEKENFTRKFPKDCFVVVKNALDFERYKANIDFRKEHGIRQDTPLLLFIARFIESKGMNEVIEAMKVILKEKDIHTVFAGDGPVKEKYEKMCMDYGLGDHVTFTGYIPEEDTVNAYLSSDVLVFPTYHEEGMPMVVFHSLASGLPVITTKMRATADWLVDGEHCLFIPPRDSEKLTEAILKILNDTALASRMRENEKELARKFDKRIVAEEFISMYKALRSGKCSIDTQY